MKEFTIDLHDGRGNQVYVLKIDQLAALEAVVKERNLEWESILGQNIRHATVNDELKERIAALTAERDRLREALEVLIAFIPDGWSMPLGYTQVVAQAQAALK